MKGTAFARFSTAVAYPVLPAGESPPPGAYYKVKATRTCANTWVRMHHFSDPNPLLGTSVQMVASQSADLNVTFAAGTVGAAGTYHWYFTPDGGPRRTRILPRRLTLFHVWIALIGVAIG